MSDTKVQFYLMVWFTRTAPSGPRPRRAVSVFDHGLLYGDGVFEGIRAYNGRVFKLERHIQRLFASAQGAPPRHPATLDESAQIVVRPCRRNDIHDGYIRLVVTRGRGDLGIDPRKCPRPQMFVIARPAAVDLRGAPAGHQGRSRRRSGGTATDALSPSIKSLNYVNNVLARMEANDRGADEALMLDAQGYVAEATADNIFIVTATGWLTPPTATNLHGITRETLIELARRPRHPHAKSGRSRCSTCGPRARCSSAEPARKSCRCARRRAGRSATGSIGPVTSRIVAAYLELVRSQGRPIEPAAPAREVVGGYRV